jgi:hypothetical protein
MAHQRLSAAIWALSTRPATRCPPPPRHPYNGDLLVTLEKDGVVINLLGTPESGGSRPLSPSTPYCAQGRGYGGQAWLTMPFDWPHNPSVL